MKQYNRLIRSVILGLLLLLLTYGLIKLFPVYSKVLIFIGKLLLPFLLAAFISYLIDPLICWTERWKWPTAFAITVVFISFAGLLTLILYKSVPAFITELEQLSEQLPELIRTYEDMIWMLYESTAFLPEAVHDKMDVFISGMEKRLDRRITLVLESLFHVGEFAVLLAVVPVLVFYFLKDQKVIFRWIRQLLPGKWRQKYVRILTAVDESLGNYIRGQLILSLAVATVTYIFYNLLDLKYALLLAVFTGIMNVIPYFGPLIGAIPAVLITATVSFKLVIMVLLANGLVQLLEGSLLSPYIMGKSVNIHPILLIFILLAGAETAGILGMILAVPAVTIFRGIYQELKKDKHEQAMQLE